MVEITGETTEFFIVDLSKYKNMDDQFISFCYFFLRFS